MDFCLFVGSIKHHNVTQWKKVQVGNDQEKAQSESISTPKPEVGKTKLTIRYLYLENIS